MGDSSLKTLKSLLVSEDRFVSKKVVALQEEHEKILHAELQSVTNVNLSRLPEDYLSSSLIPEEHRDLRAVKVTGNGNCLYNSASIAIKGDETLNGTLRILTACELYLNAKFYADHPKISQAKADSSYSEVTLFTVMLTSAGEEEWKRSGNREQAIKAEAAGTSEDKVWGGMANIMALATVLKRPVFAVYPNVNLALRPLTHGLVKPRLCSSADALHILWTRDGALDNRPGAVFQPNHFVTLVCRDDSEEPLVTKSSQAENVRPITQFFSRKPDLSSKMKGGTKRGIAATGKCSGVEAQKRPRPAPAHARKFNPSWQKEFTWLKFDPQHNVMYCSFCKEAGVEIAGQTDLATGCSSFKKETLTIHGTSNRHRRARDHVMGKEKPVSEGPLSKSFQKIQNQNDKDKRAEVAIKMNTAYFVAKEELPFTKYAGLIQLQKKNGLDVGLTYANDMKCAEMTDIIGKHLADDLAMKLKNAHFISVLIDGASDVSGTENETIHCKLVENGRAVIRLVGHKAVEHADATGITKAVESAFADIEVPDWKEKVVGFGADGASVNLGHKGGVAAKLKQHVPHLLEVHCFPHRLELALLNIQRDCNLASKIYDIMHLVWKTYHFSPKSKRDLKALGSQLGIDVLQPTRVKGSRWLPHVSRALDVFIKPVKDGDLMKDESQYAAVLQHMEHLASTSPKAEIKGRALNVSRAMKEASFVAFCHFLADMFQILGKLSLHFQRNDLILPSALSILKETVENIRCLAKRPMPGGRMEALMKSFENQPSEAPQFQGIRLTQPKVGRGASSSHYSDVVQASVTQVVQLCIQGLEDKFGSLLHSTSTSKVSEIISDLTVFNHDAWPTEMEALLNFGREKVEHLTKWFEEPLLASGCDVSAVQTQWLSLKVLVHSNFMDKGYNDLWALLLTKEPYKDELKDVLYLVEILLVLPLSAAQCERAISAQNRIKNCHRASLASKTVENLIRISAEGPAVSEFDPTPAVAEWFASSKKPRRPFLKS